MEKKMKKIKKNSIASIVSIASIASMASMGLAGCGDFLQLEPRNEIILEKFWTEKQDVENIIAGCYSGMQADDVVRRMMIWGEWRSENIGIGVNTNKDPDLEKILKENIDAKNSYTSWTGFYNVINRCNTVLKYAPAVAEKDPAYSEGELKANIAEMVALRSLCYFYLIRAFRDVPYAGSTAFTDDNQVMDLPATPFAAVLDSCINSLEAVKDQAVNRYETTKPLYQTGRITKDAIHAMLCEMYLWKQDWDNCIKYADLVIASKKALAQERQQQGYGAGDAAFERTNGYPLVSASNGSTVYGNAFTTLFGSDNYVSEYTQEIIFQLIFDDNPRGNAMIANSAVNTLYGHANAIVGYGAPSEYVLGDIEKTSGRAIFADRNKKVDCRLYENCNTRLGSINKFVTSSIYIDATQSTPKATYGSAYIENYNSSNWIVYRLPDIMLMKAEALTMKAQSGSTKEIVDANKSLLDQAFMLVNAVNKRSLCEQALVDTLLRNDYSSKLQMETLIFQERQRELMFEGKRWFDLVRQVQRNGSTQVLSQAAQRKVTTGGALIANKLSKIDAIYWPYNYEELKVNKNLKQNPAFSSGEADSYQKNY